MERKVIITAALAGGFTTKEQNPGVPYTAEEFAREARRCEEAGAAIVHVHVRDPKTGKATTEFSIMEPVVQAIRESSGILLNLTTGVGMDITIEERRRPIERFTPDLASLNPGSMNFCVVNYADGRVLRDYTYVNPFEATIDFGRLMKRKGIKPELECFCPSHVHNCLFFAKHYDFMAPPLHFSFVFGVAGGVRFDLDMLCAFIHAIPPGSTWQGIGVGPYCYPVAMASAVFGGHVRVGLEDNIYLDPTTRTLSKGSWDQAEKVVKMIRLLGLEPATPAEARSLLCIGGEANH